MPTSLRTLAAIFAVTGAIAAGCSQAAPPGAAGDELLIPGRFSLQTGGETRLLPVAAIDSAIGRIQGDGFVIEYDHGPYSDPLRPIDGDEEFQAREAVLDGHKARIVTLRSASRYPGRPYFIGVHFPELGASSLGKTRLTVYAALETPQLRTKVEQILLTVRIR